MEEPDQRIVTLEEADYAYGSGALTLRVHGVDRGNPVQYAGDVWYRVRGTRIGHRGRELDTVEILVRRGRLPGLP
ncbi:MAG TPA: hypothetical protein VFT95_04210 [Micromonosporaceae bacterium]|nr:hypothetical protein [Micromonosporaceae bacterium]